METTVEKAPTFEEKMKDRIRTSIGDLLSDEDLKKLIDKGINETFFSRQKIRSPKNHYEYIDGPTLMEEMIKECLSEQVKSYIKEYINDNQEVVIDAIKEVTEKGMADALIKAITLIFSGSLLNLQSNLINTIQNRNH